MEQIISHIVFDQKIDLEEFSKQFQLMTSRESGIIKLLDCFMNKNKDRTLVTALVIYDLHQDFIIELDAKENSTTMRLFPMTDHEKTVGVKTAMGLVAYSILCMSSKTRILELT